ncbi:Uncharacterized protein dnm_027130 [Desulfonema magnum]|uniref:Uncharacterized protein n=1 Tax=Desulfonema magnum TaxID=45655 RepID=A0A975BJ52_9BACT|nr:Uncharacterized protein dnm_027130 [Desulfonema magnum]
MRTSVTSAGAGVTSAEASQMSPENPLRLQLLLCQCHNPPD